MIKFIRKLIGRDTDKLRLAAERENLHRECARNVEMSSQILRKTRSAPKLEALPVFGTRKGR